MSVVVDSSVIVAALVDRGTTGVWAERVIELGSLHAPAIVEAEVVNVLRRMEIARQIEKSEANAAFDDLLDLDIDLLAFGPFADRIWQLSQSVTSYDAWYVAIAEAIRSPLATLDARLASSNGPLCQFMTPAAG